MLITVNTKRVIMNKSYLDVTTSIEHCRPVFGLVLSTEMHVKTLPMSLPKCQI